MGNIGIVVGDSVGAVIRDPSLQLLLNTGNLLV